MTRALRLTEEQYNALNKKPVNKYGARGVDVDGIHLDSKAEARRYSELKLMRAAGQISQLRVHVSFKIEVNEILICVYEADFTYRRNKLIDNVFVSELVVEDVKGVRTREYLLKKKLMLAVHGIEILETK